ncbi:hypothetical protein G9F71_022435 [Clostridium sp. FP2]|uniref:hypothetical protein n=1 Tax=Clostridium sp. FP2 TaxID=2724481 RepID=UPI0013E97D11|nr:hypothetical protein [Clostridium sp. FP2]MBZ9625590.1 hypothetical protein [Clostridium sp. FP2]
MQEINLITKYVWDNSITIDFGNEDIWNEDTFKKVWYKNNEWVKKDVVGVYWFGIRCKDIEKELMINQYYEIPGSCINYTKRIEEVRNLYGKYIYEHSNNQIFYNGESDKVFNRLRSHFYTNNAGTGSLGLYYHKDISQTELFVKIYHSKLNTKTKLDDVVNDVLQDKGGRLLIENCWRINYGWPILSKD